jgi:Eukaryotic protein of unknown function (DUF829)
MATVAPSKPLSAFNRISKVVSLYVPEQSPGSIPLTSPTTILFCSWMDASSKHIEYYIKKYVQLYPKARIILVRINLHQFLVQSETTRRAEVQEAVNALLAPPQENERLFVHALSNGGGRRVYNIAGAYGATTGKPLPAKAIIIDSAPGIPQFRRDLHVLSLPAKKMNWFIWVPFMSVAVVVASVVYVSVNWMPRWFWRDLVWGPHEGMYDHNMIEKNCLYGFLYSKEDVVIDWRNVEDHAAKTEERGYKVEKKLIEGAEHVQMFRGKGGERDYWGFTEKIWRMARE